MKLEKKNTKEIIDYGIIKKKQNGYVYIKVGLTWMPEHRLVIENCLKRLLNKNEVIHHINGNKSDNRIENLMLFPSQKEHSHFHRQINQFGLTQPRITEINKFKNDNHIQIKH